jgi:hypothetical protein
MFLFKLVVLFLVSEKALVETLNEMIDDEIKVIEDFFRLSEILDREIISTFIWKKSDEKLQSEISQAMEKHEFENNEDGGMELIFNKFKMFFFNHKKSNLCAVFILLSDDLENLNNSQSLGLEFLLASIQVIEVHDDKASINLESFKHITSVARQVDYEISVIRIRPSLALAVATSHLDQESCNNHAKCLQLLDCLHTCGMFRNISCYSSFVSANFYSSLMENVLLSPSIFTISADYYLVQLQQMLALGYLRKNEKNQKLSYKTTLINDIINDDLIPDFDLSIETALKGHENYPIPLKTLIENFNGTMREIVAEYRTARWTLIKSVIWKEILDAMERHSNQKAIEIFKGQSKYEPSKKKPGEVFEIVAVFLVITSLIGAIFLVCRIVKTFKRVVEIVRRQTRDEFKLNESEDSKWKFEKAQIDLLYIIGHGNFGEVHKGILKSLGNDDENQTSSVVAVKLLKFEEFLDKTDEQFIIYRDGYEKGFIQEARRMGSFNSNFIVRLVGYQIEERPFMLAIEFMENGDLRSFLIKNRGKYENVSTVLEANVSAGYSSMADHMQETQKMIPPFIHIALQVADGMAYLESIGVVHRDLAARNCMVSSDFTIKIADFGLSRVVNSSDFYLPKPFWKMPFRWMAPEVFTENKYSSKSDEWSYGVLLWELVTFGQQPYPVS